MGVTGLWPILAPTARPTPLPTLNRKRLAVDASIWIYQFLKAVRDKDGNALRNSHVVGFFRRICKLLYFGIKPVFVFDGGAPVLKRQTVLGRKNRREGRREDAARTAGRLLAVQMKKRGEEEEHKRKQERERERAEGRARVEEQEEELPPDEEMVYVDEIGMNAQQRQSTRKFYKKDAYHLPDIPDLGEMGQPHDPRIMSAAQLEDYARQFHNGEDVNMYDFSKIDFDGEFFMSLPPGDRYNILDAARLRSRLRMGLSKEQLEEIFPDRMAFSKFQIERVTERNDLTQRLMNLNGMNDASVSGGGRIAGETGREYVLVKNDGVEGGWALGVVSTDKSVGERNKPIDVDALTQKAKEIHEDDESEEDFEDVPVEGLNRLPKIKGSDGRNMTYAQFQASEFGKQKRDLRVPTGRPQTSTNGESSRAVDIPSEDPESLFVEDGYGETPYTQSRNDEQEEDISRAIAMSLGRDRDSAEESDEAEHLRKAISLSLQNQHGPESEAEDDMDMDFEDVPLPEYEQRVVEAPKPLVKTSGSMIAHIVNNRANAAIPKRRATSISSDSDSDMDMQAAMAKARKQKAPEKKKLAPVVQNLKNPFDGPLPFERLEFGSSLFKKKVTLAKRSDSQAGSAGEEEEDLEGGFDNNAKDAPKPLPPWMVASGDIRSDLEEQQKRDLETDAADRERALEDERIFRKETGPIEINSDNDSDVEILDLPPTPKAVEETRRDTAEVVRAGPSPSGLSNARRPTPEIIPLEEEELATLNVHSPEQEKILVPETISPEREEIATSAEQEDEEVEWSESDHEGAVTKLSSNIEVNHTLSRSASPPLFNAGQSTKSTFQAKSPSPLFPEMSMPVRFSPKPTTPPRQQFPQFSKEEQAEIDAEFDEFSDPEDEELLAQLAVEAEEHARFASTLNNKTAQENHASYEQELKALRNQQKKDRRDADEVSHIMITECQALLRLFGLPYITAPMEAEAQCAELVHLGLVDGIVTDDSDIFLFGGTRVYKNMFNSNKFVECYLASDLEKELSLSRDQLISIAHLLGSDYTEGLPGVGPVTAVEILSEFPTRNGLLEFKEWWSTVQLSNIPLSSESSTFRKKFRRSQGTKLFLPPGFPSPAVTEAYLKPDVDSTPDQFQWGVPDLDKLRDFLMATIGWSQERTDEVLVPVIRDMNRREREGTQANITKYFDGAVGVGANTNTNGRDVGSKRMKDAVNKLKSKKQGGALEGTWADAAKDWASKNDLSFTEKEQEKLAKKKGAKGKKRAAVEVEEDDGEGDDESESGNESGARGNAKKGKGKSPVRRKKAKKA